MALVAGGMPGRQAAAAPTASEGVVEAPDALAKKMFREQRYPEAALEFERLWSEQGTPKYLFNAAMAREMMGHELQAFVHLQALIGLEGLPEAEITKAKDRIQGLRERTVKLRVRVAPADLPVGSLELRARRGGGPEEGEGLVEVHLGGAVLATLAVPGAPGAYDLPVEVGRWELEFTSRGHGPGRTSVQATRGPASQIVVRLERLVDTVEVTAEFTPEAALVAGIDVSLQGPAPEKVTRKRVERSPVSWRLKPGVWTLEANAAGYEPVQRVFTLGAEPVRVQVQLAQAPRKGRRLALGLGVGGGVIAVTGAILFGVTVEASNKSREDLLLYTKEFAKINLTEILEDERRVNWNGANAAIVRNWYGINGGAGVLGAGLGLGIGATTALLPHQRRGSITQIAVGSMISLGGSIAYGFVSAAQNRRRAALSDATRAPDIAISEADGARGALKYRRAEGIITSSMLGIGVGLVVSGVAQLAFATKSRLRERGAALHPYCGITGGGLMFRTQF